MPNLHELFGLPFPDVYKSNKAYPVECADPQLIQGVELEIENVPNFDEMIVSGIYHEEDGSLRNHGREFITKPMTPSVLYHVLSSFFTKNKFTENNYSERTSVHLHANCLDLTLDQLATVLLLYQVYEPLFYAYVGHDRDKNIFCIPWAETALTYAVINSIKEGKIDGLRQWQKYTGLNLLPLFELGTIEFRHMAGTPDINFMFNWFNLVGSLFAFARKTSLEETKKWVVGLNSSSQYETVTKLVFTKWANVLTALPNYKAMLEDGVLNMKYSILELKKVSVDLPVFNSGPLIPNSIRPDVHRPPRPGARTTNFQFNSIFAQQAVPAAQQANGATAAPSTGRWQPWDPSSLDPATLDDLLRNTPPEIR